MREYSCLQIIRFEVFRSEGILCSQLSLKWFREVILFRHFMCMCTYMHIHRDRTVVFKEAGWRGILYHFYNFSVSPKLFKFFKMPFHSTITSWAAVTCKTLCLERKEKPDAWLRGLSMQAELRQPLSSYSPGEQGMRAQKDSPRPELGRHHIRCCD